MALPTVAVLVSLNISLWTAQKFDRQVTKETNETNGAAKDAGRFNKHLLHKDALREIKSIVTTARAYHYANTLDWEDATGTRLLPSKQIPAYTAFMRKQKVEFDSAVAKFVKRYPIYREYARDRLADMFKESDFPDQFALTRKFEWSSRLSPVPTSGDFRVDVPAKELKEMQDSIDQRMIAAERGAKKDLWDRTNSVLSTLYETLANPNKKVFHSTVHDNVVNLLSQLKELNFDDDPDLTATAELIERDLTKLSPEAIRGDDLVRREALNKTDAIMRKMSGIAGVAA